MIRILRLTNAQRVALGGLDVGRFCWCTDTNALYLGTAAGDKKIDLETQAEFIDLSDTPANYTGSAGKYVQVNATPDGLQFGNFTGNLLTLSDTPAAYAGQGLKFLQVNATPDAVAFKESPATVACRAYLSADQNNVGGGGDTKILYDSEDFDYGSDFDAVTNNKFTTPVAGLYLVQQQIYWKNTADQARLWSKIYYDTAQYAQGGLQHSGANNVPCLCVCLINAAASKDIEGYAASSHAGDDVGGGGSVSTYLEIVLLAETS